MEKLQKDHHYLMTEKCERIEVTVGTLDVYLIQNKQGIIIDVYPIGSEGDIVDSFTVWFDDAIEV